ncbi:DUF7619 domain-containing protein [Pontibacter populi]|uniref:T9SS type A sorting domain-containing protein n=1 Tax=Pontibacter populi TaxID=890055 RepID=A0ABV1RZF4_9BACT
MKHLILTSITLFLLFFSIAAQAQFNDNLQSIGGSYDDAVTKVMYDKHGNRYLMGSIGMPDKLESFNDYKPETIDFGTIKKEITNGFIAKYDKNNQCVWVKEAPRSMHNPLTALTVDAEGFVYVAGNVDYGHYFLQKIDQNGIVIWEKTYPHNRYSDRFYTVALALDADGNLYMTGSFDGSPIDDFTFTLAPENSAGMTEYVAKFDPNGKALWVKTSLGNDIRFSELLIDSQGNLLTIGLHLATVTIGNDTFENNNPPNTYGRVGNKLIVKRDPAGNILWAKSYPIHQFNRSAVLDDDDNIYFTVDNYIGDAPATIDGVVVDITLAQTLIKLDAKGKAVWTVPCGRGLNNTLSYGNQKLYLGGTFELTSKFGSHNIKTAENQEYDTFLLDVSLDGELLDIRGFKGFARVYIVPQHQKFAVVGEFQQELQNNDKFLISKGKRDIFFGELRDTTLANAPVTIVSGKVYNDDNGNCVVDGGETGLANKLLKIEPGSQYVKTDEQGNYKFNLPSGNYTVTPLIGPLAKTQLISSCRDNAPLAIDASQQQVKDLNFGYTIRDCYQLTVDIAADRRRRCMRSNTTVTYANEGTLDAHNVKIKVLYPKYVVPVSSNLPWTARLDSALIFDIGTLKAGERKSFVISDSTICGIEEIRGLSQCVKAIITPKNSCEQQDPVWSYASVAVMANYINEEKVATFAITNNGEGDMPDSTSYRMYANYTLLKKGKVKLAKGASALFEVPANVATYRIEADQVPHHPGDSRPAVSIQPSTIPTGNILANTAPIPIDAFYLDDADAEEDIFCLEITDSFDPNDKQVSPRGITSKRYIKAEDELEYLIRFQNTGTDVAYNIVVKDTISDHLDIATLRVGSASHPFTYTVSGEGKPVVTFRFNDINLPDHKTNEPGSHGYIKFKIAQRPDNPKGTVIRNTAYNYFDFNSPIATNEVINIIGDTVLAPTVPMVVFDCAEDEPTIAQANPTIALCETDQVTLQANAPVLGLGKWKLISGQATIVNPDNPTSELKNIGYGETVLEWTVTLCKKVSRAQVRINRYKLPSAPQITALPVQCEGNELMPLVATGENITWYKDAAKQFKLHTGNSYTPVASVTTTYYATQTINGCESPVQEVEVTIQPAEVIITTNADTLIAPAADSYQWYFNGEPVAEGVGKNLVVKNTGQYYVKTTVNGCVSVSKGLQHTINLPVSVLKLSPNPAGKDLVLEFAANPTGEMRVIVRNQLGQQVLSYVTYKGTTVQEQTINVASLAPGLYFIDVQVGNQMQKSKFIKL